VRGGRTCGRDPDIRVPLWEKFVVVVPLSGLNALTRVPLGKYRDDPDLFALLEASLRETVAVGLAEGVRLAPDTVDKSISIIRAMPPYHMTSMGNDLPPRTAMVRWQGGRTWPPARYPDAGGRIDLRGIEALCEWAASIGCGRAPRGSHTYLTDRISPTLDFSQRGQQRARSALMSGGSGIGLAPWLPYFSTEGFVKHLVMITGQEIWELVNTHLQSLRR
jgi:hypothetical protein